jgi:hypothetical protein
MILKSIIDRLNQRVEVSNIFDRIYGLCELTGDKGWIYYIGDGQAIPVTDYDSKQGTLFWAKRGKVNISKIDSLRVSGCKQMYSTKFNLSAYAIVRKSHLPCDGEDAGDWVASRVYKLVSGRDYGFKDVIDVVSYEVIPNGYTVGDKTLPPNFEFATVVIELEVEIVSGSEDTCYDICNTGDIPLPPDFLPCTPCLTEVAVDGITIIGNGTPADPLIAVGGGGGGSLTVRDEGTVVSSGVVNMNFRGISVNANSTTPGSVNVDVQEVQLTAGTGISVSGTYPSLTITNTSPSSGGTVTAVTGTAPIASSGGTTPDISISQAGTASDGYLSSADWNTFDGKFDTPTGTSSDYLDGTGAPTPFPTLTNGTVTSVAATVPNPTNPAFSVNVPNNTTTPSVDITANGVVSQYIRGDGSLANFPLGGGGGASVNYYLNGSISQGTIGGNQYFQMSRVPVLGGGTNFTRTNAQGNGYIAQFLTDAGDPNLLAIPSGNWNFETYFNATSGGGNPSFYIELYKYDGATFTLISSGATNPEAITGGTVVDLYVSALAVPATTLLATDRLAVRIFVTTSGRNITLHTEDNNLCQVITTFTTGLNALNGLTAQVQNFATGTAGTDFGISSTGSTHTFNLPTASASNRGALSSGDWTLFNGKFNTPSGTTSQYLRGDGSLATFPTLPVIYKTTTDTAGYVGNTNTVVFTQLIPANTFAAGDIIRVNYRTRKTGTNGNQTLRIYANTTANLSGTPILLGTYQNTGANSFLVNQMQRHLAIKTNNNNTEVFLAAGTALPTDIGLFNSTTTCAINWTIDQYLVFTIQSTSATDTNFGSMYLIEKL